jgi:organic radical activating enzyme
MVFSKIARGLRNWNKPNMIRRYLRVLFLNRFDRRSLVSDSFTFEVGSKCTLRCKHCCQLIPFGKQESYNADEILKDLRLITKVLKIQWFCLQGGEPFTHPQIARIIDEVGGMDIPGGIEIATNGTILLNNDIIKALKRNPHIRVRVSPYPCAEKQRTRLLSQLKENNINHAPYDGFHHGDNTWTYLGHFKEKREDDNEELNRIYRYCRKFMCIAKHKLVYFNGKIVECGKIPRIREIYAYENRNDWEEITVNGHSLKELEEKLARLIEQQDRYQCSEACRYCKIYTERFPPGIQLTQEEWREFQGRNNG